MDLDPTCHVNKSIIIIIIIHLYSAIFNTMCRSRALNISYAQDKTLKYYRIKMTD